MRPLFSWRRSNKKIWAIFFLFWSVKGQSQLADNILWDGGFEVGFGNSFWSVVPGNYGPNFRSMWQAGVLKLERPVASRLYYLPSGDYYLAAWVKQGPDFGRKKSSLRLLLTNQNNPRERESTTFSHIFEVPPGENWTEIGFPLTISSVRSHFFHVELWPTVFDTDILVDAVSLTSGKNPPEDFQPFSPIEAGFLIPEETCTYVDGEEPEVFLLIRNHRAPVFARVDWEIYNYREELVKKGSYQAKIPAKTTLRYRLSVADLPYGGYRLAATVAGSQILPDAFLAILPRINQKSHPLWGACANLGDSTRNFTARLMKKLGMSHSYIISASQPGRWAEVEKQPGQYTWIDESGLKQAVKLGIEPAVCLEVFKKPPTFAAIWLKDGILLDENAFIEAVCRYVENFVHHYAGVVDTVVLEDEISFPPIEQLLRVYKAAKKAAKKAAEEKKTRVDFSLNTMLENWQKLLNSADPAEFDFLSINSIHDPTTTAKLLAFARTSGWKGEYLDVPAVGQRTLPRPTSLLIDSPAVGGLPPSGFLWQHILSFWLNRPYGDEDISHGPLLRTGYYDLRVMSASVYYPLGLKSGVEYDNSPSLGFQVVAMLKHLLEGMRPVREIPSDFSLSGYPTSHQGVAAYPFREKKKAVVILLAKKRQDNEKFWRIKGLDFLTAEPLDFYGQPRTVKAGVLEIPELPVYLRTTAEKIPLVLEMLTKADISLKPERETKTFQSGLFTLEVGSTLPGFFRLSLLAEEKRQLLLDGIECQPEAKWESLTAIPGRLMNTVDISFTGEKDPHRFRSLAFRLLPETCEITWTQMNAHPVPLAGSFRIKLSQDITNRRIILEQAGKTLLGTMKDSLRAAPELSLGLKPESSRLKVLGLVTIDLPASGGQGSWQPSNGLRWQEQAGKFYLGCDYRLPPIPIPGSTAAIQKIFLKCLLSLDISSP
ncbi:MAG: hypothetical protein NC911_03995 [Candidatus Omnitrophica bacterium]|nr:hypothetical protein [Candidatus Omnitrophota bacterium]